MTEGRLGSPGVEVIAVDHGGTLTGLGVAGEGGSRPVDPAAADAVRWLHGRGYRVVLASNVSAADPSRRDALFAAGILECFTALVISNEVGWSKPHTRFYAAVLDAAGCAPSRVMFVGNRLVNDVLGPLAHGMQAGMVDSVGEREAAPARVPVLGHLSELPALLDTGATTYAFVDWGAAR